MSEAVRKRAYVTFDDLDDGAVQGRVVSLHNVVALRGLIWAEDLAHSMETGRACPVDESTWHVAAARRVADLSSDARVSAQLVSIFVEHAKRHWTTLHSSPGRSRDSSVDRSQAERLPQTPKRSEELRTLAEAKRMHIERVLDSCRGNRTEAAKILRVDRKTLYRQLIRWDSTD